VSCRDAPAGATVKGLESQTAGMLSIITALLVPS
jgi:hypothetical protein